MMDNIEHGHYRLKDIAQKKEARKEEDQTKEKIAGRRKANLTPQKYKKELIEDYRSLFNTMLNILK